MQDSTAFQGTAQRVRVADWIADAQITISTYGQEFQFTGRPDMLFARFEKYVDMVFSQAPSALTNNQITTLYASMLSNQSPGEGRDAPRQLFLSRLQNPLSHSAQDDTAYVGTSRLRPLDGDVPVEDKMQHIRGWSNALKVIYPALEVAVEHIRQLHSRQLYKLSDLPPWLSNYESELREVRKQEAEHYHPLEPRYDLSSWWRVVRVV